MVEMKDTVELMLSDNYVDRFKAEYYQLKIRYEKLKVMLDKWDSGQLEFTPTCDRGVYAEQIVAMEKYLDILADRAEIERIEL